jgi:hypothetical protein
MWKGLWDFIDHGLNDLLKNVPNSQLINFSLSAFIGYGIYFLLISVQRFVYLKPIATEICHVLAFFSIIALWHTFEDGMINSLFLILCYVKHLNYGKFIFIQKKASLTFCPPTQFIGF